MKNPFQAQDASAYQIPQYLQEPLHESDLTSGKVDRFVDSVEQYANYATDLAQSAGPRHTAGEIRSDTPIFEMTARAFDQRWQEREAQPLIHPVVSRLFAVGQDIHTDREAAMMSKIFLMSDEKALHRFLQMEGRIGGRLWSDDDGKPPVQGEIWDFHHEFENARHQFLLTRWDVKNKDFPLVHIQFIIEDLPQGMKEVRKVVKYGNQPSTSDFLLFNRSKAEADELMTLVDAAERLAVAVKRDLYGSK